MIFAFLPKSASVACTSSMGVPTGAVSGTEDKYSLLSKTGLRSLTSEKKRGRQKLLHLSFHVKKEIIVFHLHEKNNNLFFEIDGIVVRGPII